MNHAPAPSNSLKPYRPALAFAFSNAMCWMIFLGTPVILLAEDLGATPFQVGIIYGGVFIFLPLQILATTLLPRLGYKRQLITAWFVRSIAVLVPIALAWLAPEEPRPWMIYALIGAVFWFCLMRAMGVCAIMPWMYAWLPERLQGRYFSTDQMVIGASGIISLLLMATFFEVLPDFDAYLISFSLALFGSLASVFFLTRWPQFPNPSSTSLRATLRRAPQLCFEPGPYRYYLILTIIWWSFASGIQPFIAYYLKSVQGISPGMILIYTTVQYAGAIFMSFYVRTRVDNGGIQYFFIASLGFFALFSLFWLALADGWGNLMPFVAVAFLVQGLQHSFWWAAHFKYLPQLCKEDEQPLALSVQSSVVGLVAGIAPLMWGFYLKDAEGNMNVERFVHYFIIGVILLVGLMIGFLRLKDIHPDRPMVVLTGYPLRMTRFVTNTINLIPKDAVRKLKGATTRAPFKEPKDKD